MRTFFHSVTIALFFALLAITTPIGAFAGKTMDEAIFKKLLVEKSPWSVTWTNFLSGRVGTHKLRFTLNGPSISGEYFDSSTGSQINPLTSLKVTRSENNVCVSFSVQGFSGSRDYKYCMEKNGTIKGDYEGMSNRGNSYEGTATATPAT